MKNAVKEYAITEQNGVFAKKRPPVRNFAPEVFLIHVIYSREALSGSRYRTAFAWRRRMLAGHASLISP